MEENIDSTKRFECMCAFPGKPIKMEIQIEKTLYKLLPFFNIQIFIYSQTQANIKRIVCDGDINGHHYAQQKGTIQIRLNEKKV